MSKVREGSATPRNDVQRSAGQESDDGPRSLRLYHGSSVAVERPDVSHNAGFADLGHGFYLTDDHAIARQRAASRARKEGLDVGVVSIYELDEGCVDWVTWGAELSLPTDMPTEPARYGLRFEESAAGVVAWAKYIKDCRVGRTALPGLGDPAIVRAWIATEEVEMVCADFAPAEALAEFVDPSELVVQYCLLDQDLIDGSLAFVGTESVSR